MENKAYIIDLLGKTHPLPERPTLSEVQKIIGGYVESIRRRGSKLTFLCDEEGKMKHYPRNDKASELAGFDLVGNVVVLEGWKTMGLGREREK